MEQTIEQLLEQIEELKDENYYLRKEKVDLVEENNNLKEACKDFIYAFNHIY